MGSGYATFAGLVGVGFRSDTEHLIFDAHGDYDNGHKVNDATERNVKGHDRALQGAVYYRLSSGWSFGGGAAWSQLSTTNYTKSAWRPTFGGSKDFFTRDCSEDGCRHDFTMRIGADFVTKGSDWQNGSQGFAFSVYLPSPTAKRHLFYRETIGTYRFHDTVTDRTDPYLTGMEMNHHGLTTYAAFTMMYRF